MSELGNAHLGSSGGHSSSSSSRQTVGVNQPSSSLPDLVFAVIFSPDFVFGAFLFPALFLASRAFFAFIFRVEDNKNDVEDDDIKDNKLNSRRSLINGNVSNSSALDSPSSTSPPPHSPSNNKNDTQFRRLAFNSKNFLAVRFVSSLQAFFACICACVILHACAHDVIYSTHWATSFYARVATPYFLYDIWAMFQAFKEEQRNLLNGSSSSSSSSSKTDEYRLRHATSFLSFVRQNALILAHHLFVSFCLFPGVVGPWRRDRGDLIIACFFLLEASTPFVSTRAVLHKLGLSKSNVYIVNGLLMLVVFGFCRILIFPFIYWIYSRRNITGEAMPLWRVPFAIPLHCNISCAALFALQLHWFLKMLRGAIKLVTRKNPGEMTKKTIDTITKKTTAVYTDSIESKSLALASQSNNNNNNNSNDNKNEPVFVSEGRINQSINQKLDSLSSALSFSKATECPMTFVDAGNFRAKTD